MVAAGAYLRAYRERLGLSQEDVAKALGKSQAKVVTEWEAGKRATALDVWNLWVEMLGANPATAQRLVIYGQTREEGRQAAYFTYADAQAQFGPFKAEFANTLRTYDPDKQCVVGMRYWDAQGVKQSYLRVVGSASDITTIQ